MIESTGSRGKSIWRMLRREFEGPSRSPYDAELFRKHATGAFVATQEKVFWVRMPWGALMAQH